MIKNIQELLEKIYEEIRNSCDVAVVGMSGGADSTLVTTLCVQALGKENVYGIGMPYNETDLVTFNNRSYKTAKKLGINYFTVGINIISEMINNDVREMFNGKDLNKINKGNSRSRSRMCVLYSIAHELGYDNLDKRVRVVGTGNLSEDFLGYDTKGGDALCDFFPIGQLFKSEVYQLLDYFISQGILTENDVDRKPSAGLWEGQYDEDELGYSYSAMEPAIRRILVLQNDGYNPEQFMSTDIEKFVWNRHVQNAHKHQAPPVFELRGLIDKEK